MIGGPLSHTATEKLIELLCCRIGMIMEDASVAALTIGGVEAEGRSAVANELEAAANGLIAAIKALST
jgi:hypothetical protein